MSGYVFAPAAHDDLVSIYLYTFERWNRDQADIYAARIIERCEQLAAGTLKGKRMPELSGRYLKASVGSHFIVCRHEGDNLVIVRILHQRMDIPSHLAD